MLTNLSLDCQQNKFYHLKGGDKVKKAIGALFMAVALVLILTPATNDRGTVTPFKVLDPGTGGR